jgi:hypothetical protein
VWTRLLFIEVTGADDGLSHRVAQHVYDECLAFGDGKYVALCGRLVPAASMNTQPGKPCAMCVASVRAQV